MPFVNNEGVKIHYEVEGEGLPLVLQHGFTGSLERWRAPGYLDALRHEYQLVLVDARGHGASDKPYEPEEYDFRLMADDVIAVLDVLGISKAHFWGYSMGGRIGFFLATHSADRFHSFVLGGVSPLFRREERRDIEPAFEAMKAGGMEGYLVSVEQSAGPLPHEDKQRMLANDPEALVAVWEAMNRLRSLRNRLQSIPVPCLLYVGEDDPRFAGAKEAVGSIPRATFFSLPGINHRQGMARSDLVLPRVKAFLRKVRVAAA